MTYHWLASFTKGRTWTSSGNTPIANCKRFLTPTAAVRALTSTGGGADVYRLMMQRPGQRAARVLDARRQTNDWQGKWVVQP